MNLDFSSSGCNGLYFKANCGLVIDCLELAVLDSPKTQNRRGNAQNWLSTTVRAWIPKRTFFKQRVIKESLTSKQMDKLRKRVLKANAATDEITEELTLTLGL